MRSRNVVFPAGHESKADVGTPQVENLVGPSYHSEILSAKVSAGRANSAVNSEQAPDSREASEAPRERWSRGCRRAHVWFWFWQWSRLSPLAPRRQSRRPSRSPRKSWTPASTSKLAERACRLRSGRPAPNLDLLRSSAVDRSPASEHPMISPWSAPLRRQNRRCGCTQRGRDRC
jgi:hypothetical protein